MTGTISRVEAEVAPNKDFKMYSTGLEVPVSGQDVVQIESQKQT
ncbi:MAG TPA: hypothetical protein VJW94_02455 [Candidatus Acidoferrum sp.]|nr:hypothetical protein [Candidatus Acidoferrum sp.]